MSGDITGKPWTANTGTPRVSGRDADQPAAPEVQAVREMVRALRLELPAAVLSDVERRVEAVVARITDLEAQVAALTQDRDSARMEAPA